MKDIWYRKKWVSILLHGVFWMLFFIVPYLLQPSFQDHAPKLRPRADQDDFFLFNLLKCFFWMGFFYLNAYKLIPAFAYRKRYFLHFLCLLGMLGALSLFEILFFSLQGQEGQGFHLRGFLLFNFSPFLIVIAGSTAYRMSVDRGREEQKEKEKLAENLQTELSFLRSQISPHFIFNVLNNIVALARKKSDLVEPSLIKLSALMRYFLYEDAAAKVPLQKEIEYLQSYIDLQQLRFGKNLEVLFELKEIDQGDEVEPMLLIPFVENAFKHGVVQNGYIHITLEEKNGLLHFSVENRYQPSVNEIKDASSGIGLTNVKRRLNLLYANSHVLMISDRDGVFKVSLELKLR